VSALRDPLQRVVVAGAGQVGILAAIGVKRALPAAEVIVLGLPSDPGALADRAATALPFSNRLHDRLGIAEHDIVSRAQGSHRLLTRYVGWGGRGQSGAVAYGANIDPALRTRFAQEWGGGPRNMAGSPGLAEPAGSLAEALVEAGRFAVPPEDAPNPLSEVDYALRWNPDGYRTLLIAAAQRLGVQHMLGDIAGVELNDDGCIAALSISGVGQVAADLFVDCTGPRALLLTALPAFALDDWSAALPLRRLIMGRPGQSVLALEDRFTLFEHGWVGQLAGRDGMQAVLGVSPDASEADALRALGAAPLAGFQLEPGRARAPWLGNVVALGDAAARFEPLGHFNLDLAHRQLDLLLELLPGRMIEPLERAEYNRRSALMMDAVRDTLAAHYAAPEGQRVFGPAILSPQLATALDQFARRGRIPFREEAPLLNQEFQVLLAALGHIRGTPPQARAGPASDLDAEALALRQRAATVLAVVPPYAEWMARAVSPTPA
jgi:tryptophan halogenase